MAAAQAKKPMFIVKDNPTPHKALAEALTFAERLISTDECCTIMLRFNKQNTTIQDVSLEFKGKTITIDKIKMNNYGLFCNQTPEIIYIDSDLIKLTKKITNVDFGYNRLVFFLTFVIIHESSHWKHFNFRVSEIEDYIKNREKECVGGKLSTTAKLNIKKERGYQEPVPDGEEKPEAGRYLAYILLGGIIQFNYLTYDLSLKEGDGRLIMIDSPFAKASINDVTKIKELQTGEFKNNNQKIGQITPKIKSAPHKEARVTVKQNFKIEKSALNNSKKKEPNQEYNIIISASITNNSSDTIKLPPEHFPIETASNLRCFEIIYENNDRLRDEIAPHTHSKSWPIEYLGLVDVNPGNSIDYKEYDLGTIFSFKKDVIYELDSRFNEYILFDDEMIKVKSDWTTLIIDLSFQTFEQTAPYLSEKTNMKFVTFPLNPKLEIRIHDDE
jgi:hypothetical protein